MMHLAIISHEYPPQPYSGIGAFTVDLAEGLVAAGWKVTVFAVDPRPNRHSDAPERADSVRNGVRVIRLALRSPAWMRWRPGEVWQRLRLLHVLKKEHRADPFDVLEAADAWGWLPFGKIRGVPMITRVHGAMFFFDVEMKRITGDPMVYWLEQKSFARSDHFAAVSKYVAREEMALSRVPKAPFQLIYNAVDTDLYSPPAIPVAVEKGLIVFVNSIQYRKGVYELCQAMNILAAQYPEARLVLIGRLDHGSKEGRPIADELMELVRPEFRDRVQLLGWLKTRQEVIDYLRKAHVCCYPSRLETFGIAPAEAMSVGKPTVYSSAGPGPEVIEDGVSGLLCDSSDPADIAAKIKRVFDDPALAEKLGREARRRVVERFSKRDWIRQNIEFYQSCLTAKKR